MKNVALFIGRFQPFHRGHLEALQKAIKENDRTFIAIGSTENNYLPENPFTAGERMEMIQAALKEAKISAEKYNISTIPNINNYALWPHHVQLYLPPFQKIYTGSTIVKKLYEDMNKNLKNPYQIVTVKKELKVSGSQIRHLMLTNKKWEHLVPKSVAQLLKKWGAIERLKYIQTKT